MGEYEFRFVGYSEDQKLVFSDKEWEDWNRKEITRLLQNETAEGNFSVIVNDRVEELDAERRFERMEMPLKIFLMDLLDDNSKLVELFQDEIAAGSQIEAKTNIFLRFFKPFFSELFGSVREHTKYEGLVRIPHGAIHIVVWISRQYLAERFDDSYEHRYGYPSDIVVEELTPDEILTHIAPWYYAELGMWDREKLWNDPMAMEFLRENGLTELNLMLG